MSKVKPILFSAPMVRALLDGSKTQTRRVLKAEVPPSPGDDAWLRKHIDGSSVTAPRHSAAYLDAYCSERKTAQNPRGMSRNWCWWTRDDRQCLPTFSVQYAPGDLLWVRESWTIEDTDGWGPQPCYAYMADHPGDPKGLGWRPSIFMPRTASRITLEVTGVKVERLNDITDADALAEGVTRIRDNCHVIKGFDYDLSGLCHTSPVTPYYKLWEHLNGPCSWDANPWIVAVTFKVHPINVDAFLAQRTEAA